MADHSPSLRERQAQLTRAEILKAARTLFAERGYSRTSVRDIATSAGVSAQTVYDSIGSKQAVVARLNDLIDEEAGIREIAGAARGSADAREVAATSARVTRSILEHCGDIVHALVTGAAAEPDLAGVLADGRRRHIAGAGMTVGLLQKLGALAPGLDTQAAVDTLSAVSDVEFAMMLRDSYGWSLDRIEAWITDTSRALLLADV
jgi:AcrR family transcriptional regulator